MSVLTAAKHRLNIVNDDRRPVSAATIRYHMKQTEQTPPQAQPAGSGLSLDVTTMATAFREVVDTYLHIHTAETNREKSSALRGHTVALLRYIDAVDQALPTETPHT